MYVHFQRIHITLCKVKKVTSSRCDQFLFQKNTLSTLAC